jgi:SpoVK/Ycf46/Vps4 family AAA+-type ATPase
MRLQRKGVNLLIHGDPGTGKTELARLLAREIGIELIDVASEDEEGFPIQGGDRLRALRAAQNILEQGDSLILFDEASDIFDDGGFFNQATADKVKGWLNHQLGANPVPVIWITNSIESIDPAFIRRFDIVQEISVPPRSRRAEIIKTYSGNRLADATVTRLAEIDVLSPAVCQRAIKVAECVMDGEQTQNMKNVVEHLIVETIKAQGHGPIRKSHCHDSSDHFDLSYLACDADLHNITEGISRSKSARLCLYGPPGTGKTAYGHWLSRQIDMPFHAKQASDLISPWIGQTEKNLDRIFREAEHDGAVLLLDEIDGFLQDRRGMQHSWELTQVNEALVQLENYSGVFIASTNLIERLDQAALRRFDLKIHFHYLRPEQAWKMFLDYCELLQLGKPQASIEQRIRKIENLTPGDFAVVLRRSRFQNIESPMHFAEALENECSLKEDGKKRTIGFV